MTDASEEEIDNDLSDTEVEGIVAIEGGTLETAEETEHTIEGRTVFSAFSAVLHCLTCFANPFVLAKFAEHLHWKYAASLILLNSNLPKK